MAGRIFVNYRRDDSASHALNVAQYLEATFGRRNVFLDIDRMRAGQSFPTVLRERLAASKVMLAIIGPSWLDLRNEDGQRRLDDPADWVRLEIATALTSGTVVIPVLVGGASLPRKAELPPDLQALTDQHAVTVTTNGFRNEMAGLARDIRAIPGPMPWGRIGGGAAATLAVVLGGWTAAYQLGMPVWVPFARVSDPQGLTPSAAQAERDAKLIADAEQRIRDEIETKRKSDEAAAAKKKADEDARAKAAADAEAKRKAEEEAKARAAAAETKRLADLAAAEERRKAQEMSPGRVFRDCTTCPEMIVVPSGSFTMGSPASEQNRGINEGPQRQVTIARTFAVGRFEVTFAEWDACVAEKGCTHQPGDRGWGRGKRPVIEVSWNDAKEYVAWLSRKTGQTYRLLSEAEWEYAARAGTSTPFSTGAAITTEQANFDGNYTYGGSAKGQYRQRTVDVGSFQPNAFGLYDMHGNVNEWVEDCYADGYAGAPVDGSVRTSQNCVSRVLRGGSWFIDPRFLRSAKRDSFRPDVRLYVLGFRLARTLSPTP